MTGLLSREAMALSVTQGVTLSVTQVTPESNGVS